MVPHLIRSHETQATHTRASIPVQMKPSPVNPAKHWHA